LSAAGVEAVEGVEIKEGSESGLRIEAAAPVMLEWREAMEKKGFKEGDDAEKGDIGDEGAV